MHGTTHCVHEDGSELSLFCCVLMFWQPSDPVEEQEVMHLTVGSLGEASAFTPSAVFVLVMCETSRDLPPPPPPLAPAPPAQ